MTAKQGLRKCSMTGGVVKRKSACLIISHSHISLEEVFLIRANTFPLFNTILLACVLNRRLSTFKTVCTASLFHTVLFIQSHWERVKHSSALTLANKQLKVKFKVKKCNSFKKLLTLNSLLTFYTLSQTMSVTAEPDTYC